jgi:mannose-6-phosphate isomerase-like protein (cupin superfamily)
MMRVCILVLAAVYVTACGVRDEEPHFVRLGPDPLPDESFEKPPEKPLQPGSLLIYPENMTSFYDHPGEAGFFAFGDEYGFDSLSFVITETHPHGGPPLHTHSVEEAHVLLSGTMEYVIGEQKFRASAPYIARVPANAPHAFVNAGDSPLNLIGILPTTEPDYQPLGPNPLIEADNRD